jgi:glycolate oxidase iron-sulfur subunit
VYNVRAALEGRLPLTPTLTEDIYTCLTCRACESVCPAGVPVGAIMEGVRGLITERRTEPWGRRSLKRWILTQVIPNPRALGAAVTLLRLYQVSGVAKLIHLFLSRVAPEWGEREGMLPPVPPRRRRRPPPRFSPALGPRRGRVSFFTGCIASHFFSETNRATVLALQQNGFEVVAPREQRCCGALALHNGFPDAGRALARRNLRAFDVSETEAVVVNAAGCGAALAEYGELVHGDVRARAFAEKVVDVSRFLVERGMVPPARGKKLRAVYDDPCHLAHGQGVREEPRRLLSQIPGVELVPFHDSERCCGSAGIYNLTHYRTSMQVLDEKMRHIAEARPDAILSGNPGCLMQLAHGVRRAGLAAEVLHPVVLLARAYATEPAAASPP